VNPLPTPVAAAASGVPPAAPRWSLRLLGGLRCEDGTMVLERLPSRATTALLARLALWPERVHAREELVELLWPGVALDVGRNRLRQVLSTLRSLLEPAGQPARPVLQADRHGVRVVPGSLACDVHRFEALVRAGRHAEALAAYGGALLPGFYDDWIDEERCRLAALHADCEAACRDLGAARAPATAAEPTPMQPAGRPEPRPGAAARSIPHYLTRLFGIDAQAARLQRLVFGQRLVTLVGPGGCGKTRLAAELARALAGGDALACETGAALDLVAFVPLVACRDASAVLDALQTALPGRPGGLDGLVQGLADRRVQLVLDNCEQLGVGAVALLAELLARLPGLHMLATSRRPLGIDGEQLHAMEPLPLPAADADLAAAAANPALALFVDRARAVRADFHLGPGNRATLVALVRALEGLPLALELAAARVRAVSPAQMLERLSGPAPAGQTPALDLLARSGPRAAADPRHASMAATLAWSWDTLDAPARRLLTALTTFAAGAPLPALAALCPGEDVALTLEALGSSLLLRVQADDERLPARASLPEPLREFAASRLAPDEAREWRRRQCAWWVQWAQGLGATPPLPAVRRELPNLAAAIVDAVADGEPQAAVQLALALRPALTEVALPGRALAALAQALEHAPDADTASRGHTLLAWLRFEAGEGDAAQRHAEQALALAPAGSAARARALHASASLRWRATRRPEGLAPLLDEAERLAGQQGDDGARASVLALRAYIANVAARDPVRAEQLHRQALALWQRQGNGHVINGGLYNLALCAANAGRHAEALERLDAVCATARAHEDWEQLADALNVLGTTRMALRDWPGAVAALRDCVRCAWQAVALHALAYGLWNLPRALAHVGQPEAAARLMGFAAAHWQRHFGALAPSDALDLRRVRRLVAVQRRAARAETWMAEGAAMSAGEAVRLALAAAGPH
jgi:predicted ATPase